MLHYTKIPTGRVRVTERVVEEVDESTGRLLARSGAELSLAEVVRLGIPLDKVEATGPSGEAGLAALEAGADPGDAEQLARTVDGDPRSGKSDPPPAERLVDLQQVGISTAEAVLATFAGGIDELVAAASDPDRHDDLRKQLVAVKGIGDATATAIIDEFFDTPGDEKPSDTP